MICFDRNADYGDIFQDILDFIKVDPLLWTVIVHADRMMHQYGVHATVTSFMDKRTDTSVHSTGRAVDIRSRHILREGCRRIEAELNHAFPRTDNFRTCVYHDVQGIHFHLQVPAKSIQEEEEKTG